MNMRRTLLATLLSSAFLAGAAHATTVTVPVAASGDTSVSRSSPNLNRGNETLLELRNTSQERIVVKMDPQAIREAIGAGRLVSARLELELLATQSLGSGAPIEVRPLLRDWNEGDGASSGATWNCANDTNLNNNKVDCTSAAAWDMDTGAGTWGSVAARTVITSTQTGTVAWDVTTAVNAELAGQESYGWLLMKGDGASKARLSFASRERSAHAPRLVLTVEPPSAMPWTNWNGAMTDAGVFRSGEGEHDTLMIGTDRVLWAGQRKNDDYPVQFGHLRLFAIDRQTHAVTVLAESSLSALLPEPFEIRSSDWNADSSLFRLADGGVVLAYHDQISSTEQALVFVTLDVDDKGFQLRGAPVRVDIGSFLESEDAEIDNWRAAITQIADGRFLFSYRVRGEESWSSNWLNLSSDAPDGLSLYGQAAIVQGELMLTEAGAESGVAVWEIDLVQGEAINISIYGQWEEGKSPFVIDRQSGAAVMDAMPLTPRRLSANDAYYLFIAPYTGKAYVKVRAPEEFGASMTIRSAYVDSRRTENLRLRTVDLSGATPVVGETIHVPGDGPNGEYLHIRSTHINKLDGGRVILHVNSAAPESGWAQAISRVITLGNDGMSMGDWSVIAPDHMGPDYPFSTAINTDTMAEGMLASVAWDAMDDEPLIGPFSIDGDRITSTGARLLTSESGDYKNQVAYLGNNQYLLVQEVDGEYDETTDERLYNQHFYVFLTDGKGKIVSQSGPFVTPNGVPAPRIEKLDDNHLLVLSRKWYGETTEEHGWISYNEISARILHKD